jgi:hypothetical protein
MGESLCVTIVCEPGEEAPGDRDRRNAEATHSA